MRELTDAEYRTAQAILSQPEASERDRIERSGLPASTYHVARRRIYAEGWLEDRLIPNPRALGFAGVEFAVARPSIGERGPLLAAWGADPDTVLLWSGLHALFLVRYRSAAGSSRLGFAGDGGSAPPWRLCAETGSGGIPVYFDYSGLWARFGGESPPENYPRGLALEDVARDQRRASALARSLSRRPDLDEGPDGRLRPRHPSRVERRGLEWGILQQRTLIDPVRVPPLDGRRLGEVIVVFGEQRPGMRSSDLLTELVSECRTFPILMAAGEGRTLLVGLGQTDARSPGRHPVASARGSVLETIERYVEGAQVVLEPVESLSVRVGHRYPSRSSPSSKESH